ncbi:protein downstream neighbor of Son [Aplysia californica]|uniref:Protein downstream neighbor of Son n=1 Tax=Aplysia californica TaxID=6500 RepID=A0ABM0JY32_APLCA|nr:protein downstream neighbor of Son [Aplysia californica]
MEWKNPHDIMRTHKIRRASSDVGLKRSSSSSSLSRKLSGSGKNEAENIPALHSSKSDMAIYSTQTFGSKRRNPFGRDSFGSPRKRRSVLSNQSSDENSLSRLPSADEPSSSVSIQLSSPGLPEKQTSNGSKLIDELNLADCKLTPGTTKDCISKNEENSSNDTQKATSEKMSYSPVVFQALSPDEREAVVDLDRRDFPGMVQCGKETPPVDWSLKTKLRIVTTADPDAMAKRPGVDARHLHCFVHQNLENGPEWDGLDLYQKVRRCCFHYSYPHLPWMISFPRMASHFRSRSASIAAGSEDISSMLHSDWSQSFTSIYQQLRSGVCPYFYLCCHQFTVLFRCQRSLSAISWSALLSPSTRGLRELLTKEGISFSLPNISNRRESVPENTSGPSEKDERDSDSHPSLKIEENVSGHMNDKASETSEKEAPEKDAAENSDSDEENVEDHRVASLWLEGMGLDKKDFPSLEPAKVKIQLEGFREIDNRPSSMVYVEGADIHPFFNFLLNYPGCIANSGPQMGIPPTILSPVPFAGGVLTQNTVKISTVKGSMCKVADHGDASSSDLQVFEVAGPVLPHHTLNIASVLRKCQSGTSSTMSFSNHTPCAAFNTRKVNDPTKDKLAEGWKKIMVDPSLANPGLLGDVKHLLAEEPILHDGKFIKDLQVVPGGFSWA